MLRLSSCVSHVARRVMPVAKRGRAFSSVTTVHNNTTPSAGAAAMFSPLPTPVLPSVVVPTVADSMFMSGCMTPLSAPPAQEGTALHTLGRNSRHPKKPNKGKRPCSHVRRRRRRPRRVN